MNGIGTDQDANSARTRQLARWRGQNFFLTMMIGPLIGGEASAFLFFGRVAFRAELQFGVESIGQAFTFVAAAGFSGFYFGFIPALACALITNFLHGYRLSRNAHLLFAPLIGAASVVFYCWLRHAITPFPLTVEVVIALVASGALAAAVCATLMEFRGCPVPKE